jgi:glycerol-3-phosphate cytidylyltransferase
METQLMAGKKTVITYGTFDMLHVGHLRLFKRLARLGDRLIVAVSTDEFNLSKNKKTLIPFEQRVELVSALEMVDLVIAERCWEQKLDDVTTYNVDVFGIGADWKGKFDFLKPYCDVVYLERTRNISTTDLKKSLRTFLSIPREDLLAAFDVLDRLRKEFE